MNWTNDQKKIIDARLSNLLVSAAAGSGKTAVLVERIIQMISDKEHPINVDELLVVTFTKAAAAQMKEKIAVAIEKMLESDPENSHYLNQLQYINQANILTIDSFCYQVVKEHFHVLGIDPNIRVGEAGEIGLLCEEVLENVIEQFYENNKDFVDFSDAFSADKSDENVEDYILKIYRVCSSYPCPDEWIKQAKDALEVGSEDEFVAIDYVKKYFDELHGTAVVIKDVILECLEKARSVDGAIHLEKTLLADIQIIDDVISANRYSQFFDLAKVKFPTIARGKKGEFNEDVAAEIKDCRDKYKKQYAGLLKSFRLPFDAFLQQLCSQKAMLTALLDATEEFRVQFLEAKLGKGMLEFSDVEHFALQVLCEGYDEEGIPIPSGIGKEMAEDFKEILIDEYQDSNYLQEAILQCVSTLYKGQNNIFMVGDVKQSIYSFRMARPDLFMDKYHNYSSEEDASCRKLLLKNNFRSRANVLESINYIFYQIMGSDLGGINYTEEEALVPGRDFPNIDDDSVELLIGESKDFDFLSTKDEEMSGEKEENLDENLEDIGKMELEATMVARRIEKLMGLDGIGKPYQVVDDAIGELRDAEYRDMVILLRGLKGIQPIFQEILMAHNIPVKVQNENGYFDTVEIKQILSLLKVVDNPHNDVEMAAALRGYFGGFTNDDLALLTLIRRELLKDSHEKMFVFSLVKYLDNLEGKVISEELTSYEAYIKEELSVKCSNFLNLFNKLQEIKENQTIGGLLAEIYYKTGYYYYVTAMPDGMQRARNLDLLMVETKKFENGSFQSVFDFLQFVDRLQKKSIELGGDPAAETNENAVRIMSIHKSKGLEFPIVFLSGMGKGFNKMDTKLPLIVHSDYYLAAKYRDTKKRSGNDSFTRNAFTSLMITEGIAEELRIFYVGLTRAKEKLIMTGVTQDIPKLIKKYEKVAMKKDIKLSYGIVHTAENYLDLITAAFIRNSEFHEAMKQVRKRMNGKEEESIISAEYEMPIVMKEPDIRLKVEVFDFRSLVVSHVLSNAEKQMDKSSRLTELERAPMQNIAKIEDNLSWEYEKQQLTTQKSKISVTEIKRMYEVDLDASLEETEGRTMNYKPPVPRFIAGNQKMDAATRGTWLHKTMELLDNAKLSTREQVEDALVILWQEDRLPEETREFVTVDLVYGFVNSPLGKRMCEAAKHGELYKEKQFVVGVSPEKLTGVQTDDSDTKVVVQGIIDAYFKEGDNLILLDYKSDHIKPGEESLLVDRYKTQLQYYKDTLEQLTGLSVSETYIYSFALNKEIRVF